MNDDINAGEIVTFAAKQQLQAARSLIGLLFFEVGGLLIGKVEVCEVSGNSIAMTLEGTIPAISKCWSTATCEVYCSLSI